MAEPQPAVFQTLFKDLKKALKAFRTAFAETETASRMAADPAIKSLRACFEACLGFVARPERLVKLALGPSLVAFLVLAVIVPLLQNQILPILRQPLTAPPSSTEVLWRCLAVFAIDLIALVPWLWLASVMMMQWPRFRQKEASRAASPSGVLMHWRALQCTALMVGVTLIITLALSAIFLACTAPIGIALGPPDEMRLYLSARLMGFYPLIMLILLARYGLVLQGLSEGRRVSLRESRSQLKGHSFRLFLTLLLVTAAFVLPVQWLFGYSDWGRGPLEAMIKELAPIVYPQTAAPIGSSYDIGPVFGVFVFAPLCCAVSEVLSTVQAATQPRTAEPWGKPSPSPA